MKHCVDTGNQRTWNSFCGKVSAKPGAATVPIFTLDTYLLGVTGNWRGIEIEWCEDCVNHSGLTLAVLNLLEL